MTLFHDIFGSKDKVHYIKEIDKELHGEIRWFLRIEELCKEKVTVTNAFLETWNKHDLPPLKAVLKKVRPLVKRAPRFFRRFQRRIRDEDHDLMQAIKLAGDGDQSIAVVVRDFQRLKELQKLEEGALRKQLRIISVPDEELLAKQALLRQLFQAIQLEAQTLGVEKQELETMQQHLNIIKKTSAVGLRVDMRTFAEQLEKDIISKKELKKVYAARDTKHKVETLLLNKEFDNEELPRLLKVIGKNEEAQYVQRLLGYQPRIERIIKVLTKLKEHKPGKAKPVERAVTLLKATYDPEFLKKLQKSLTKQAQYARRKHYYGFIYTYQQEKLLFFEITAALERMGAGYIPDEVIRSGFLKDPNDEFEKELAEVGETEDKLKKTWKKKQGKAAVGFVVFKLFRITFITLRTILLMVEPTEISPESTLETEGEVTKRSESEGSNILASDPEKIREYITELERRELEFTRETVEAAQQLMKRYGFRLYGEYELKHCDMLKGVLAKYSVVEVRRFLNGVLFIPGKADEYEERYAGLYISRKKAIRVFLGYSDDSVLSTTEHEVAHARSWGLPEKSKQVWIQTNAKGVMEVAAQQLAEKVPSKFNPEGTFQKWKAFYHWRSAAYGYARPYGVTDYEEDIATFVEMLEQQAIHDSIPPYTEEACVSFVLYLDVYIEKAKLLVKFGFVKKETAEKFIAIVKHERRGVLHINGERKSSLKETYFAKTHGLEVAQERIQDITEKFIDEVLPQIKRQWDEINKQGLKSEQLRKRLVKKGDQLKWTAYITWGEFFYEERYGFVSSVGTKSTKDDVISFIGWVPTFLRNLDERWNNTVRLCYKDFLHVFAYVRIYKQKLDLLKKEGLIAEYQHDRTVQVLDMVGSWDCEDDLKDHDTTTHDEQPTEIEKEDRAILDAHLEAA